MVHPLAASALMSLRRFVERFLELVIRAGDHQWKVHAPAPYEGGLGVADRRGSPPIVAPLWCAPGWETEAATCEAWLGTFHSRCWREPSERNDRAELSFDGLVPRCANRAVRERCNRLWLRARAEALMDERSVVRIRESVAAVPLQWRVAATRTYLHLPCTSRHMFECARGRCRSGCDGESDVALAKGVLKRETAATAVYTPLSGLGVARHARHRSRTQYLGPGLASLGQGPEIARWGKTFRHGYSAA